MLTETGRTGILPTASPASTPTTLPEGGAPRQVLQGREAALKKLEELVGQNLVSKKLTDSLREKLDKDGSGLMTKVGPEEVLKALGSLESLKSKGYNEVAIRAAANIGFARGGVRGIEEYLVGIQSVGANDFQSYAQLNNALSIVWFNDKYPGFFDDEESSFLDISGLTARARSTVDYIYSGSFDSSGNTMGRIGHPSIAGWEDLLSFISQGEGGYNSMNQGTSGGSIVGSTHNASSILGKNLTDMTIGEVMSHQQSGSLFAAGRYQIIPDTMKEALRYSGLTPDQKFSPENQDKLAVALILHKRPYLGAYLLGKHNDMQGAMREMAREWASVPDPATGSSYYGSGNRASHSVAQVRRALASAREQLRNAPGDTGSVNQVA